MTARGTLVVLAKAPRPGLVKTRMCPPLTPEQAAELYACMLDDVLHATLAHASELGLDPVVAVHPADALGEVADRAPGAFRVVRQRGDGLAARMDWAMREACATGCERVILRGSDNPAVGFEHVRDLLDLLGRHDVVLTPDRDGGYGMVGVRAPVRGLFDHEMSAEGLLDETLRSARAQGIDVALGEEGFDLDSIEDLATLDDWRRVGEHTHTCARTIAWIDDHALWPARTGHPAT